RQEDNYQYAKLVFPPTLDETWNGNVLNTFQAYNYQYTSLNTPYTYTVYADSNTLRTVHFDSTLTVLEFKDSASFQSYGYCFEQYATGIGMFHRVVYLDSSSVITPGFRSPDTSLTTTWGVWYTETCLTSGYQ
ncbi:MAG TPA: hypothetical protein VK808_09205, partial [Bacteroidia bacterium]|nr:hypothetical protein [Bacteroidia bacterium]